MDLTGPSDDDLGAVTTALGRSGRVVGVHGRQRRWSGLFRSFSGMVDGKCVDGFWRFEESEVCVNSSYVFFFQCEYGIADVQLERRS